MDVLSIHEDAIIELSRVQRECWTKLYGEPEMSVTYYDVCYNTIDRTIYAYRDCFDPLYSRKWVIETLGL